MFKFSLVLLVVSSALFCQAIPVVPTEKNDAKTTQLDHENSLHVAGGFVSNTTHVPNVTTPDPTTSKPNITTQQPDPTTSKPNITTHQPDPTTSKPNVTTHQPDPTTSKPNITTHQPDPTTSKPITTITPPKTSTASPKPSSDGGFNLISFLGGMILGLGLLAIGYVIFKFYQTRRDSSYRTL